MSTDAPPDSDRWPLDRRKQFDALDRLLADVASLNRRSSAMTAAIECAERAERLRHDSGFSMDSVSLMSWLRGKMWIEAREDIAAKEGPKA